MLHPFNDTFDSIIDLENIRKAYLDLVLKFDKVSKSMRYRGVDGIKMSTLDFISEDILTSIRSEMIAGKKISPAYMATIPKKNGKKRKIYVYSVKERIKAEAIYRVLWPIFDTYFSPYLFSYRSSHPSYYAAKSAVRRYKRFYGENHVLVTDISNYADTIDHSILLKKLTELGIDMKTLELLELFIKTDTIENGSLIRRPMGVLTGTPLYAILSNFYMDEFDKWAGKKVAFYRRVGDDIIAMDKNEQRIREVSDRLTETVRLLKLELNKDKARLIKDTEEFKFLGYSFKNKKIGFDESSMNKALTSWKKSVGHKRNRSDAKKIRHVRSLSRFNSKKNIHDQFDQLIKQKILVDDTEQIKEFSERHFKVLTSFFKGSYSPKKRRVTKGLLSKTEVPSLFKSYIKIRYPKKHAATS
jgi:hypothetical protein